MKIKVKEIPIVPIYHKKWDCTALNNNTSNKQSYTCAHTHTHTHTHTHFYGHKLLRQNRPSSIGPRNFCPGSFCQQALSWTEGDTGHCLSRVAVQLMRSCFTDSQWGEYGQLQHRHRETAGEGSGREPPLGRRGFQPSPLLCPQPVRQLQSAGRRAEGEDGKSVRVEGWGSIKPNLVELMFQRDCMYHWYTYNLLPLCQGPCIHKVMPVTPRCYVSVKSSVTPRCYVSMKSSVTPRCYISMKSSVTPRCYVSMKSSVTPRCYVSMTSSVTPRCYAMYPWNHQ